MTDADTLLSMMPLARTIGLTLDHVRPDRVVGTIAYDKALCTAANMLHGGIVVSLADSVAGMCAYLNLPEGASTSTIELKVNFFGAIRGGTATAEAEPLHVGRTTIVVQTNVFHNREDGTRRRVAQVTQTQAVLT